MLTKIYNAMTEVRRGVITKKDAMKLYKISDSDWDDNLAEWKTLTAGCFKKIKEPNIKNQ